MDSLVAVWRRILNWLYSPNWRKSISAWMGIKQEQDSHLIVVKLEVVTVRIMGP